MPKFKSFDGTQINYFDNGFGPAVILLHGFGVSGIQNYGHFDNLLPLFEKLRAIFESEMGFAPPRPSSPEEGRSGLIESLLSAGARVIAPDMRGFGDSDQPTVTSAYSNSAMARDVAALINHLNLDDVGVLGFSMGAVVATKLLVIGTNQVKSAIVAGIGDYVLAGVPMDLPKHWPIPEYLPKPLTMRAHALASADILESGQIVPGNLLSGNVITAQAAGANPKAWAAVLRGEMAEQVTAEEVHTINVPVMIVNGAADVANQSIQRLLAAIPTSTSAICEGDHGSTVYQPTFQNAVCKFFLNQ